MLSYQDCCPAQPRRATVPRRASVLAIALVAASACLAQTPVGELQQRERIDAPPAAPVAIDSAGLAAPVQDGRRVTVREFRLSGASAVAPETLLAELAPLLGHTLAADGLRDAARRVADAYVRRGRLARVRVVAVAVAEGVVELAVTELRIGRVSVDRADNARVPARLVDRFLAGRLEPGGAPSLAEIGRQVALLDAQPGVAAAAEIDAGERADEVDVTIRVRDRDLLAGSVAVDNHGLREIGQNRLLASLRIDNAFGAAERLVLRAYKSEGGAQASAGGSVPLGSDGVRAGVTTSHARYEAVRQGAAFGLEGWLSDWALHLRQPLASRPGLRLDAEYRLTRTDYREDSIFGPLDRRRIDSAGVEIEGAADAEGVPLTFGVEFERGVADYSRHAADFAQDAASSRIDGDYWRLRWKLGAQRPLAGGELALAAKGQWADRNLDATRRFALGGPDGVRAYPNLEALGDRGWLAHAEWRHSLSPQLDGRLFADTGGIERNAQPWTAGDNRTHLSGAGAGISWRLPGRLRFDADAAWQIGGNSERNADGTDSDGRNDPWRVWLSLSRTF